jgi:flagella synthesis protein FlgN
MSQNELPLLRGLTEECAAWEALLQVLNDEERALVDGEADRLMQLNAAKLQRMHAASDLARARLDTLRAAGHTPDAAGMAAWLAQQGIAESHAGWQTLRSLEEQAQATNQRIGKLIDMRLGATRQALNVLLQAAAGQAGLYDQAGQSVAARPGKPLTAA